MKEFFTSMPVMAWSIVSVMVALATIALLWQKVRWWWHNTWYSFPVFGKISTLSKDTNRDSTDSRWFKAEKTLCRDYKRFIKIRDEIDFNEKITYLNKAGDSGRKDTPKLVWLVAVLLVFVEAMGFSYVLAGFTIPGASENMQQLGAYGIAFLISVILVWFTHAAGHELYKSGKIKFARQEWIEGGRKGKTVTGTVPLARPQSLDDDQPGYTQLMNRVGAHPTYVMSILTAVFVVVVAIGATYVRGQVLEKQLHQDVVGKKEANGVDLSIKLGNDGLNITTKETQPAIKLPAADAAENARADAKAIEDDIIIDRHGGWGTFIVLAFIFVFLQILGVFFGFRWGFAGLQSRDAFYAIGGGRYSSYADVREHYKEIADVAQSKLEHLQQKLMARNSATGNDGMHTTQGFYDFMEAERRRDAEEWAKDKAEADRRKALERVAAAATAYPGVPPTTAPEAPISVVAVAVAPGRSLALSEVLSQLEAMGQDKEAKKELLQRLPADLVAQVMAALKAQKEEKARRASALSAEMDELL